VQDSLSFHIKIIEIETIIQSIKKKFQNEIDLFNKLSFLPKTYLLKNTTCKNWHDILTCTFTKKAFNLLSEPYYIYYFYKFSKDLVKVAKINDKLCFHNNSTYIDVIDNSGYKIDRYDVYSQIYDIVVGHENLIRNDHEKLLLLIQMKKGHKI
jgi:hypothetical protein